MSKYLTNLEAQEADLVKKGAAAQGRADAYRQERGQLRERMAQLPGLIKAEHDAVNAAQEELRQVRLALSNERDRLVREAATQQAPKE